MRRLQVLFVVALLGVLAVLGAVAARLGGWPVAVGYGAVVLTLLAHGAARARAQQAARSRARSAAGRTCTCCTGTVHDPVQVR